MIMGSQVAPKARIFETFKLSYRNYKRETTNRVTHVSPFTYVPTGEADEREAGHVDI